MTYAPASTVTTTVRLVYLARLREAFASAGESLVLTSEDSPSVRSVVDALRSRGGAWAAELADGRAVRYAVNHRVAHPGSALKDGDEVAVFPPVTGG
ncbi:MAG: MoaD/ThiS family protein [Betaproteobacteria bacterium]|nr:MoaD/ThiS family protein [Betaproteobacteria bacterium]MDE2001907.1 MoaD/ThiS family protein [Betaproteobacteria bacterium]MDE2359430.1 MoaD/ThiS family protein [Betaproteobacteria bacterium]